MPMRPHMSLERESFNNYWDEYEMALQKYALHRFKFLILGKELTADV